MELSTLANNQMIYGAGPYSDPDRKVIIERMAIFDEAMAGLIISGVHVISPLFNHHVLHHRNIPGTWDYWKGFSLNMMSRCDSVLIITIDGWQQSSGVIGEIQMAKDLKKPVYIIKPDLSDLQMLA